MKKLEKKECNYTYEQMIENVNDIAGIRIICPLKKDIFSIRNIVTKLPGIKVLKERLCYKTKGKWLFKLSFNFRSTSYTITATNICKSRGAN